MDLLPASWPALCALAFALGARHGFDADHLATIDGIARYNAATRPRLARCAGVLFSLGHGAVVVGVAAATATMSAVWTPPAWLEASGLVVSLVYLFGLGCLNLRAVAVAGPDEVVRPAGLRGRLLRQVIAVRQPWAVLAVGALFAVSFDTVSQAAVMSLAGERFGGAGYAVVVAFAFVAGMLAVDGLNGAVIARLVRKADRTARVASRVMAIGVAALSIAVGVLTLAKLGVPAIERWADGQDVRLGAAVALAAVATFGIALFTARRQRLRPGR